MDQGDMIYTLHISSRNQEVAVRIAFAYAGFCFFTSVVVNVIVIGISINFFDADATLADFKVSIAVMMTASLFISAALFFYMWGKMMMEDRRLRIEAANNFKHEGEGCE
jgi:protein-S-isoprenylcysteine O-methyltransferase Ste14